MSDIGENEATEIHDNVYGKLQNIVDSQKEATNM